MSDKHHNDEHDDLTFDEAEFEALRHELSPMVDDYRENVIERVEPSPAYRSSMNKMILGLIREDVLETHRKASWTTKLAARTERWLAAWRELVESSTAFRLGAQGAMALGLGLLLTMAWVSAIDKEPLEASPTIIDQEKELVPESVWEPRISTDEDMAPKPLGNLPTKGADAKIRKK